MDRPNSIPSLTHVRKCDHAPDLCCGKCADQWATRLAKLPKRALPPIISAHHQHTVGMRLAYAAALLEADPSLLEELAPLEIRDYVIVGLRHAADVLNGGEAVAHANNSFP